MAENVTSFTQLGQAIEGIVQERVKDFVIEVWDQVVLSPVHPRDTGTLQHSWKVIPYIGGDQGAVGDVYKPAKGTEKDQYGKPDKLNLDKYTKQWSNYILFNNQPYVNRVASLPNKPYTDWIQDGIDRAIVKFTYA